MYKLFAKNVQKDLQKPVIFLKSSKYFIIKIALGKSYRLCFASFSELGIFSLCSLSLNGDKLSVKLLHSPYQDILLCKS